MANLRDIWLREFADRLWLEMKPRVEAMNETNRVGEAWAIRVLIARRTYDLVQSVLKGLHLPQDEIVGVLPDMHKLFEQGGE